MRKPDQDINSVGASRAVNGAAPSGICQSTRASHQEVSLPRSVGVRVLACSVDLSERVCQKRKKRQLFC